MFTLKRLLRGATPALAGVFAVFLLLAQAVAVSSDLHHWLHEDAGGASHVCVAVLLQQGLVEGAPALA